MGYRGQFRHGMRPGATGWFAAWLLAFLLIEGTLSAQNPSPKGDAMAAPGQGRANARARLEKAQQAQARARSIAQDLRALAESVNLAGPASPAARAEPIPELLKRLGRPTRTVQPPTLTSAEIDSWLDSHPDSTVAAPSAPTTDESFLRRVSLDLRGSLPTPSEIADFLDDTNPEKRSAVIDRFLQTAEYSHNWARYWRDVIAFRATTENPQIARFDKLEDWLSAQLAQNRAWDLVVSDLITATGRSDEQGSTALLSAHSTNQRFQPVEMAGETARIFLGISIGCAQCHDHPTDSWKQRQFHEFAAFFAGATARLDRQEKPPVRVIADQPDRPYYRMQVGTDPANLQEVEPQFFLASRPIASRDLESLDSSRLRALGASYVTGQDNPWFARSYVNRIWTELMPDRFYDLVDDLGPERTAHNEELLDQIASQWSRGGYDVAWLFRTLMNTRAYQQGATTAVSDGPMASAGASEPEYDPNQVRLRADAIYDALFRALELKDNLPVARIEQIKKARGNAAAAFAAVRLNPRNPFTALFGVDPSIPSDEVAGTIPQALFLMNGQRVDSATRARPATMLGRLLAQTHDDAEVVNTLYLRVLARKPNPGELQTSLSYVQQVGNRSEAFEDLLWALVNSTEFLTRR